MAASYYKLDNLVAVLDKNRIQATGPIAERFDTNPLAEKWKAFGWRVSEIDGHNMEAILKVLDEADGITGALKMVIAHTIKGCGISFAENKAAFHNGMLDAEQFEQACGEFQSSGSGFKINSANPPGITMGR